MLQEPGNRDSRNHKSALTKLRVSLCSDFTSLEKGWSFWEEGMVICSLVTSCPSALVSRSCRLHPVQPWARHSQFHPVLRTRWFRFYWTSLQRAAGSSFTSCQIYGKQWTSTAAPYSWENMETMCRINDTNFSRVLTSVTCENKVQLLKGDDHQSSVKPRVMGDGAAGLIFWGIFWAWLINQHTPLFLQMKWYILETPIFASYTKYSF